MIRQWMICIVIALGALSSACAQHEHDEHGEHSRSDRNKARDIAKLYNLVRQARADLAGLRGVGESHRGGEEHGEHGSKREGRGEHGEKREGHGEHGGKREGRGEHGGKREGRGEHGGEGEEGGRRVKKNETWDETRNGARLILKYDEATRAFKGSVVNTTKKTLKEVRVEVHLSNGTELGPTKRRDMKPGTKMAVELSAGDNKFTWWTTHPEHGSEEGHHTHGEEGSGEHGSDARPRDPALRPLYNQLQLLRQEIRALKRSRKKL